MNTDEHDFRAVIAEADPQRQLGLNGVTRVTLLRTRWDDRTYNRSRREVLFATMTVIRKR